MKTEFPEFHPYSEEELVDIWGNCNIVLDTNVLLSAYGLTPDARKKLFEILSLIEHKLVMPYQVGLEFHRNRLTKIDAYLKANDDAKKEIIDNLNKLKNKLKNNERPFNLIKSNEVLCRNLISVFEECTEQIKARFKEVSGDQLSADVRDITKDLIYDKISTFFNGKINKKFDGSELEAIYKEGALRYSRLVPPGFEDMKTKPEPDRYGDLIIWKELIQIANKNKKNIIFVTNDTKDDWWFNNKGKKEPRSELRQEFNRATGYKFEMYTYNEFVRLSAGKFSVTGTEQLEKQVEDLEIPKDANRQLGFALDPLAGDIYIYEPDPSQVRLGLLLDVFSDSVVILPISSTEAETRELKKRSILIDGKYYILLLESISLIGKKRLVQYFDTLPDENLRKIRIMVGDSGYLKNLYSEINVVEALRNKTI